MRVSTAQQSTRSQKADLKRWVDAQNPDTLGPVQWYTDKSTGKTMDRPDWQKLQQDIDRGAISKLVVWRLDRLGRTASGLCKLFEELQEKKVRLVSLMDSIDLGTASGRLIANVLASVAAYETEIRGERVRAGQKAAKDAGKKWGGSVKGRRIKVTDEQVKTIHMLHRQGEKISRIARAVNLSRVTIYRILNEAELGRCPAAS
jgi:DNA invertase Pin-like site-specific DNA recombinase